MIKKENMLNIEQLIMNVLSGKPIIVTSLVPEARQCDGE